MKCVGKTRYVTADEAADGLKAVRARPEAWDRDKVPQRFYSCDLCGGFHLTAMTNFKTRKKK